jgi:hypothetical protein
VEPDFVLWATALERIADLSVIMGQLPRPTHSGRSLLELATGFLGICYSRFHHYSDTPYTTNQFLACRIVSFRREGRAVAESTFSEFNQQRRQRLVTAEKPVGLNSCVPRPWNGRNGSVMGAMRVVTDLCDIAMFNDD